MDCLGLNLKELLAYNTQKYVTIHDRRLGSLYYGLCLLAALWVIGFQVIYGNEHYKLFDVNGSTRLTIQQPTKDGCNPRKEECEDALPSLTSLPYCAEGVECVHADMVELSPMGVKGGEIFVPTRIDKVEQGRGCSRESKTTNCTKLWKTEKRHEHTFIAGIESYTVMLVSSYFRNGIRGMSSSHQGFYYECTDPTTGKVIKTEPCKGQMSVRAIDCLPGLQCHFKTSEEAGANTSALLEEDRTISFPQHSPRHLRGGLRHRASTDTDLLLEAERAHEEVDQDGEAGLPSPRKSATGPSSGAALPKPFSIPQGDVFELRKLLELAGVDLDDIRDVYENQTIRKRGAAISVQIEYTNLRPFHSVLRNDLHVGYIYRVVEQELDEMKTESYSLVAQPGTAERRIIENRHGVLISSVVSGSFGEFDIVYLLVMLTTSLALLNGARILVDLIAIYMPSEHKAAYRDAKYQHAVIEE